MLAVRNTHPPGFLVPWLSFLLFTIYDFLILLPAHSHDGAHEFLEGYILPVTDDIALLS